LQAASGDHAVHKRIAPSVQIEAAIDAVLAGGLGGPQSLAVCLAVGAFLVLVRGVVRD
jgi:hypothetical protein